MNNIRPELYILVTSTSIHKEQKAVHTMLDASAMAPVTSMIAGKANSLISPTMIPNFEIWHWYLGTTSFGIRKVLRRTANIQEC